ncbi:MAG: hypothetical protein EBV06_13130, partial [Planctomycetia bacterium]|nr:hypothetical protein [Planctomycetia bacterium]
MIYRLSAFFALTLLAMAGLDAFAQEAKDPISRYAMDLRCRTSTQVDFDKDAKKFGIEVYSDAYNNDGLYVSDSGSLTAVGSKLFKPGDGKGKEPLWRHGLTLTARKAGDKDWDKGKKVGLEVFRDEVNGNLLYVNELGQVSAAAADAVTDSTEKGKVKAPKWLHAMDLKVRKAGEKDFTKDTRKIGLEVFRDENNGNLIYISEAGSFGISAGKLQGELKGNEPKWQYGLELSVRKAGEAKFSKDTKKIGIEVFQDENNGSLIYITESGAVAIVPGKNAKTGDGKAKGPEFMHGMELAVRRAGERDFTKETKKISIEVYKDENNSNVIYIS